VDGDVKAGLLDLVDHAVEAGWSARRAGALLGLDHVRLARWQRRRAAGHDLDDHRPGGQPLHALLPGERAAILDLYEQWRQVDRSHRKLAHRGSRVGLVHVSESMVLRVLAAEGLVLQGRPAREPAVRAPWPDWVAWKPNVIWCYDFTHFTRARRVAIAVMDVVSRRWLATTVSAEETSTQVEVAFTAALAETGLDELLDTRLLAELRGGARHLDDLDTEQLPVLLAMSDNGPQMRSHSTREFMAACAIMQRFGRPSTPSDQAWIESLFSHVKASGRTWRRSATPASSRPTSTASGPNTTRCACTPASATSPPTTSTTATARPSARHAATGSPQPAPRASPTVEPTDPRKPDDRPSHLDGYFTGRLVHLLRRTTRCRNRRAGLVVRPGRSTRSRPDRPGSLRVGRAGCGCRSR